MPRLVLVSLIFLAFTANGSASDVERVTFRENGKTQTVTGEVMIEAKDGGVMLLGDTGRIWTLQPDVIDNRIEVEAGFTPMDSDELSHRLLNELGNDFSVHQTKHYVIVYNSSEPHAKRVGALFEALYSAFFSYWKNQRWDLPQPRFPLVAVLLKDHDSFLNYGRREIGESAESMMGYYNLASNRMITFNVPNWERNVSTIIHEATHQLAYNCGLQKRFADNPMWVSEGLATYFEAPNMKRPGKWRAVGSVNRVNLGRWNRYLRNRPQDSLFTLLADDTRYLHAATATDAYGEGWAITYFLIKTNRVRYVDYLRKLSEAKPLAETSPEQRIEMFESAMGKDWETIDKKFVKFMRRVSKTQGSH